MMMMMRWFTCTVALACAGLACEAGDDGEPQDSGGGSDSAAQSDSGDGPSDEPAFVCGPSVEGLIPSDPECWGLEAQPTGGATPGEAFIDRALEAQWASLRGIVGQYACGDAPIYRGRVTATDNRGSICCGREDGSMEGTSVVASLVPEAGLDVLPVIQGGVHLFVFSPAEEQRLLLRQELGTPDDAFVSLVTSYRSSISASATCEGCLEDLTAAPDTLTFDLTAHGEYGGGEPMVVRAEGLLARVAAQDVTWSDIVDVNVHYAEALVKAVAELEPCGGILVRESNGRYTEPAIAPPETTWHDAQCQRSVAYTVRWWIDPDRVARHGIQDFAPAAPEYCCEETDQTEGPFERECFDFDAAGP